jgi:hypothetical protein
MTTMTVRTTGIFFLPILLCATGCVGSSSSPPVTYDVAVIALPPDGGTVSGGGSFVSGDTTTLTALPADGYLFSGWSGGVAGTADPLTVTVGADLVTVAEFRAGGRWTWMGGPTAVNQSPVFGTPGVPNPANHPGSRVGAACWTDSAGNAWLFGGFNGRPSLFLEHRSDLWRFDGANWAWMGGPQEGNRAGVYGTTGVANPANFPGAREGAATWKDGLGNLWLFGGWGYMVEGTLPFDTIFYGDLWRFDGSSWSWMHGPKVAQWGTSHASYTEYRRNAAGVFGTPGVANPANRPGGRGGSAAWMDSTGLFWLYGGQGYGESPTPGGWYDQSDLWSFDLSAWTWRGGGKNHLEGISAHGTRGVGAPGNSPGNRHGAAAWSDSAGNGWLFGGWASFLDPPVYWDCGYCSDLWKFNGQEWTWVAGPAEYYQAGHYGIRGAAGAGNFPGARCDSVTWRDSAGNTWLFGGWGLDATGAFGYDSCLSDLWRFDGSRWAWMGGPDTGNQPAVWGTLGLPAPGNRPGGRSAMSAWSDSQGSLWLYGGSSPAPGWTTSFMLGYSDLWRFTP